MVKIFLATLSCILILAACNNPEKPNTNGSLPPPPQRPTNNAKASIFHQRALDDYNKKELKYYFQSIHYPTKNIIQYFKDSLQIRIISSSDYISGDFSAYNQTIDSIVFVQKNKHISEILGALH